MMQKSISLFIITGFLGSGKTSVLNSLLEHMQTLQVGLILNDFGSISVDGALVNQSSGIVSTKSLSGGQIFCNCLSASFVKAIEEMSLLMPDVIFVEASGLAKPSSLMDIIAMVATRTEQRVSYKGMLCIVDAQRYPLLSQSLKTLEEQVVYSDWFILNKRDLVDEAALESVSKAIETLCPGSLLVPTSFGKVDEAFVSLLLSGKKAKAQTTTDASLYLGWGEQGRPKSCLFLVEQACEHTQLTEFLTRVSPAFFRIKGFVPAREGKVWSVSAVGEQYSIQESQLTDAIRIGLVCIHAANVQAEDLLNEAWNSLGGSDIPCQIHTS